MCLLLQLQGLSKSFGDRQVLHQLEWELPRGRGLHALLAGPGQGKSVLARILEGMLPAVGDVRVNGAPPGPGALGYVATEPCGFGDGYLCSLTAQPVPGIEDVSRIAVGAVHTCAVTVDGDVWCWGDNYLGQLADGSTAERDTPAPVTW